MDTLDNQVTVRFEQWNSAASYRSTPRCSSCNSKPILLPLPPEDRRGNYELFQGRCYNCAKENHGTEHDKSFIELLRTLLKTDPQQVFVFDEELPNTNFSDLQLMGSFFLCCDLTLSNFKDSNLSQVNFFGSLLNNTQLSNATLEGACLLGCQSDYALIEYANLRGMVAGLEKKSLSSIQNEVGDGWLYEAWQKGPFRERIQEKRGKSLTEKWQFQCREASLRSSDLTGSRFIHGDLRGTGLNYTRLQEVDFTGAQLQDSSFSHTSMGETIFAWAQLDRVDMTASYTPDPAPEELKRDSGNKLQHKATVCFDHAVLAGAFLKDCYFLKATFIEVLQAQRTDCRGIMLGPGSKLSGDFSNSRFNYAHLVGCNLGIKNDSPINLRDNDFSHAHFVETSFNVSDFDSASFAQARFENRSVFKSTPETNEKGRQGRNKLIRDLLESVRGEGRYINSFNGNKELMESPPAAMNFESATLGILRIKNIRFLTANFSNSYLLLTSESKCSFTACSFDNALIGLSACCVGNYFFEVCSFHNGIIVDYEITQKRRKSAKKDVAMKGCAFNATAFRSCSDRKSIILSYGCNADCFKFVECIFDQTSLDKYFQKSLDKLVLKKCRFLDGQYMGLYSKDPRKRRKSEKKVLKTVKHIVQKTVTFVDPTVTGAGQNTTPNDDPFADSQYLWNMFAMNFRRLAIPYLESECLCNLRDLDLLPSGPMHSRSDQTARQAPSNESMSWKTTIFYCSGLLCAALVAAALFAGISGSLLPEGPPRDIGQPTVGIAIFIFVFFAPILAPILISWLSGIREKKGEKHSDSPTFVRWLAIYSKAIYYYGEKPIRAFASWMIIIAIFGLFYWLSGVASLNNRLLLCNLFDITSQTDSIFLQSQGLAFLDSLYFSAVTFTTLGFGDLHPLYLTKFIAALEACIGAVMMALFVLCFARRTAAR